MYQNIERCCQLHESVEVYYEVDIYTTRLTTSDRFVISGCGETIEAAMVDLDIRLEGVTLDDVRSGKAWQKITRSTSPPTG